MFESKLIELGTVCFPEYNAEKVYMLPFFQKDGVPDHLKHWQPIINQLLETIKTDKPIYLMIDQQFVKAGNYHRREGIHIDGYWVPSKLSHGSHSSSSGHSPYPVPGGHSSHVPDPGAPWNESTFSQHEGLILASNISAAKGYVGKFKESIENGGDCSHVNVTSLKEIKLEANKAYLGNVTFLHESIPVEQDCYRTVIRLNIPGLKIS